VSSLSHSIAPPSTQASFDHSVECPHADRHACGGTAPPENAPPPANQRAADPTRGQVPAEHARRAWKRGERTDRALRLDKPLNLSGEPWRVLKASPAPVKDAPRTAPVKRTARARAVHSHASHGGARKAADDGDGDRPRWLLSADRSHPRIVVAADETVDGRFTFRMCEATGATRAEALGILARMVRELEGVPAWEAAR
jgi:hypothetical protein